MDDARIQGELRQIFPQVDATVIQRTIDEARSSVNEGEVVDILTLCIQFVLDWQAGTRIINEDNSKDDSDDVIVVKSVKKEHSRNARSREIPVVYVGEGPEDRSRVILPQDPLYSSPPANSFLDSSNDYLDSSIEDEEEGNFFNYNTMNITPSSAFIDQKTPVTPYQRGHTIDAILGTKPQPSMFSFHHATPNQTISKHGNSKTPVDPNTLNYTIDPISNVTPLTTSNYQLPSATTKEPVLDETPQPTMSAGTSLLTFVKQMFPKVDTDFVQDLSQEGHDLNAIVSLILDRPDKQNYCQSKPDPSPKEHTEAKRTDYFKEYSQRPTSALYYNQCLDLLKNEFRRIAVNDIRKALGFCNYHYAPARKLIEEALLANSQPSTISSTTQSKKFSISRLLASKRGQVRIVGNVVDELKLEIDFVKEHDMLEEEKKNAIYAAHVNEEQYKDAGQLIECGCCFGEFPFEEIVQCSDGHLFCKECLHGYAKEIIFGSSMTSVNLTCMGEDCDKPFPYNQLEKCLTREEINKYQSRLQEDCLAKAEIPNLHQCPFCEFAAIVPERERVFACMNPKCAKESCKECNEEWKEHFGLKCSEIEKKSQTNLRLSYEERMTMAKVRKCAKCSLTFTKLDGCNKMTCRCGSTQCYVCRKPYINYDHFCRHPRDPGMKCTKCTKCSLWSDPSEDDELAIKQLQDEAAHAKRKLDEEIELSDKKQKV